MYGINTILAVLCYLDRQKMVETNLATFSAIYHYTSQTIITMELIFSELTQKHYIGRLI